MLVFILQPPFIPLLVSQYCTASGEFLFYLNFFSVFTVIVYLFSTDVNNFSFSNPCRTMGRLHLFSKNYQNQRRKESRKRENKKDNPCCALPLIQNQPNFLKTLFPALLKTSLCVSCG